MSEIPLSILWCRQTSETKPVSSTWRVRGRVSRSFMVSISGTKPDIEPVGEWGKHWVWLTCCHVSTWTATLCLSWMWSVAQFVQSFSFSRAPKSIVTFIFLQHDLYLPLLKMYRCYYGLLWTLFTQRDWDKKQEVKRAPTHFTEYTKANDTLISYRKHDLNTSFHTVKWHSLYSGMHVIYTVRLYDSCAWLVQSLLY